MRHADGSYRWISWIASADDHRVYASGRHVTAENAVIGNERLAPGMHIPTKPFAIDALAQRIREPIASR